MGAFCSTLQYTVTLQIAGNVVNRVGYTINVEIVDFKEAVLSYHKTRLYILEKRPELDLSCS